MSQKTVRAERWGKPILPAYRHLKMERGELQVEKPSNGASRPNITPRQIQLFGPEIKNEPVLV